MVGIGLCMGCIGQSLFTQVIERSLSLKKYIYIYIYVGSQIVAHTLIETGNGPNKPNTINLWESGFKELG